METALSAFFAFLGTVIGGGVVLFAREQARAAREDAAWWRDKGFLILERLVETQEAQVRGDEARDRLLRDQLLREKNDE